MVIVIIPGVLFNDVREEDNSSSLVELDFSFLEIRGDFLVGKMGEPKLVVSEPLFFFCGRIMEEDKELFFKEEEEEVGVEGVENDLGVEGCNFFLEIVGVPELEEVFFFFSDVVPSEVLIFFFLVLDETFFFTFFFVTFLTKISLSFSPDSMKCK